FKPHTDDVRESRAYVVIKKLVEEGAKIIAYDPKGIENFKHIYPEISEKIEFIESCRDALERVEIVLITTEWPEFEELDYSGKIVIDGRRIKKAEKSAKIYEGVCW
ncbi:MAG: UDP binding domain-containing protein, partial [Archaeoglobaceae archaeon]